MQEPRYLGDSSFRHALCAALWLMACGIDDRAVSLPEDDGAAGTLGRSTVLMPMAPSSAPVGPALSSSGVSASGPVQGAASVPRAGGCAEGARRCVAGSPETCSSGAWVPGAACADPLPFCLAATGQCVSCEAGAKRCTGEHVEGCGDDGAWLSLGMSCTECVPRTSDCVGSTARVCSELGAWVGQTCAGATPSCVPETGSCACTETSCAARELCSASGRCEPLGPDCPTPSPTPVAEQDLGIVRVRFDPDGGADVLMQNLGGGFISFAAQGYQLCNGAGNCVFLSDAQSVTLVGDDTFSRRIPNTLPSGGELAVVFVSAGNPTSTEAYVTWGNGAGSDSFEPIVNETLRLWNTGERIGITAGDTGFVSIGDTSRALGYASCNP